MEFEFLVEDGEFFVEDAEVERLMEETGLSEDEVMDLVSESLSDVTLEEVYDVLGEAVETGESNKKGVARLTYYMKGAKRKAMDKEHMERTAAERAANLQAGIQGGKERSSEARQQANIARYKDGMTGPNAKRVAEMRGNMEGPEAKKARLLAGMKPSGMSKNAKIAAGAVLGTAALAGGAYAVNKALKKRKAKKEADKDAQTVQECMIDLILDEDAIYVSEDDMDFLLEACDYELSENEILYNIEEAVETGESNKKGVARLLYNMKGSARKAMDKEHMERTAEKRVANLQAGMQGGKERANVDRQQANLARYKDGMRGPNAKRVAEMRGNMEGPNAKKARLLAGMKPSGMSKNAKIAAGVALGTAAAAGGAYALNKALKKRKAKKAEDKDAQTVQECMIDLVQEGEYILVSESDMDFLLEACDYELTQEEILANLAEAKEVDECFPGDGIVAVTSDKVMAEVRERQSVDMDEEHCDNGMMADCSVAPETKQRIKKPKCMHEDVEYDEYLESFEGDHLINEAILDDADIRLSEDEMFDLIAENLLSERSVVRLDKAAKRSQAEAKALVVIAREQNDPLYKKLVKCYKQKQAILAQLDAKYGSRAIARVRKNAGKMNVDK